MGSRGSLGRRGPGGKRGAPTEQGGRADGAGRGSRPKPRGVRGGGGGRGLAGGEEGLVVSLVARRRGRMAHRGIGQVDAHRIATVGMSGTDVAGGPTFPSVSFHRCHVCVCVCVCVMRERRDLKSDRDIGIDGWMYM